MEAIQKIAAATASNLRETVAAQTIDFITSTSLQILPLAHREPASESFTIHKLARKSEKHFTLCMRTLASAFARGNDESFNRIYVMTVGVLQGTGDETLVNRFFELMHVWKADKVDAAKTVLDKQEIPSDRLKSLFAPADAKPTQLEPAESSRESDRAAKTTLQGQVPPDLDDLVKALRDAHDQSQSFIRPSNATTSNKQLSQLLARIGLQQPNEVNGFGIETSDGVLLGHPPPFPPGLLDWESPEDEEEFDELVSNRRARTVARESGPANSGKGRASRDDVDEVDNSRSSEDHEAESDDDEWIHI